MNVKHYILLPTLITMVEAGFDKFTLAQNPMRVRVNATSRS